MGPMRSGVLVAAILALAGCRSRPAATWFPLGGEVHSGHELAAAQARPLAIHAEPRWFVPVGLKQGSPEAFEPGRARAGEPLLRLRTEDGDDPDTVRFVLTLRAGDRDLYRETEHRWTNTLPFLFAFRADGMPVTRTLDGWGKHGGISRWQVVSKAAETRTWIVRVSRASIAALLGKTSPSVVQVVAAFSETQHEPWGGPDHESPLRDPERALPNGAGPVVVLSNVARLP